MPKQKGPFRINGRIDEMSFYSDKINGDLARRKGGPTKEQIKKSESMEPVRQNNDEFGRSSKYGALLRAAMRAAIVHCREYTMSRRLQTLILSLMKMDAIHKKGKRVPMKEHLIRLQEFELNEHTSYKKFFKSKVDIELNKETVTARGKCSLPKAISKTADYYKVVSVLATVDFQNRNFSNHVTESELLPCDAGKSFIFQHTLQKKNCLFYGLVICFYKKNSGGVELIADDKLKAGFISFLERDRLIGKK